MKSLHRHEAMRPLSRHHHHALAIAMKIRRTLTDEVTAEDLHALRDETVRFWETGGRDHFREEEEILLPAYSRYASVRHEEIINMLMEHVTIRGLASAIREGEDKELEELLHELSDVLERHVRREERMIFPMIQAALPEQELKKLAPYFHEFNNCILE